MTRGWHIPLLLLLLPLCAWGDYPLEVIQLHGRPVEEVLPIIRPFVAEGGSVAGMNDQLILRTSPRNLEEIRQILKQIDRPPRRLLISVSQGAPSGADGETLAGDVRIEGEQGSIGVGAPLPDSGVRLGGIQAGTRSDLQVSQRVQTIAGRPAFIATGRSVPVVSDRFVAAPPFPGFGEHIRYRDVGSGFYALPRVNGDRVTIEISPWMEHQAGEGQFDTRRAATVVSGRLGEWIPVAASSRAVEQSASGGARHYSTRDGSDYGLYLRVDELP